MCELGHLATVRFMVRFLDRLVINYGLRIALEFNQDRIVNFLLEQYHGEWMCADHDSLKFLVEIEDLNLCKNKRCLYRMGPEISFLNTQCQWHTREALSPELLYLTRYKKSLTLDYLYVKIGVTSPLVDVPKNEWFYHLVDRIEIHYNCNVYKITTAELQLLDIFMNRDKQIHYLANLEENVVYYPIDFTIFLEIVGSTQKRPLLIITRVYISFY